MLITYILLLLSFFLYFVLTFGGMGNNVRRPKYWVMVLLQLERTKFLTNENYNEILCPIEKESDMSRPSFSLSLFFYLDFRLGVPR